MTPDRIIGRDGTLPWHLPEDLRFFKRTTSGHPVVMGRRTYESIGRPLPNRQNIVLTRDQEWSAEGVDLIHDPTGLQNLELQDPHVFIIGGAQVYAAFLAQLDDLLVSHVFEPHPGDTTFPTFTHLFPHHQLLETHDTFEVRRWSRT